MNIGPRNRRHFKTLAASLGIVLITFILVYCFVPESLLTSQVPTVFTLSISSVSIFLALYSFTSPKQWYPEDARHIIMTSDPMDWEFREKPDGEELIYKNDRAISIRTELFGQRMDYHEPWMDSYAKTEGTKYKAKILRDNHQLEYCYLIWVDGKILIPEPTRSSSGRVTKFGYNVGRIIEMARAQGIGPTPEEQEATYDDVLNQAGLAIEN